MSSLEQAVRNRAQSSIGRSMFIGAPWPVGSDRFNQLLAGRVDASYHGHMRWTVTVFAMIVLVASSVRAAGGDEVEWTGKVVALKGGDLLVVRRGRDPVTMRLSGVACPELTRPFGRRAWLFTARRLLDRTVWVRPQKKDARGAGADVIARVMFYWSMTPMAKTVGRDLGQVLVRAGLARCTDTSDATLVALQKEAKQEGRGMWWKGADLHKAGGDVIPAVPSPPPDPDRACKRSRDCTILRSVCPGCPPCELGWQTAGNRKAAARIRGMQTRVRCATERCQGCAVRDNYLGTTPACVKGQCVLQDPYLTRLPLAR